MSVKSKAGKALGIISKPRRTTNPDAFTTGKTIARTKSPTSFTAELEGKSLSQISISIRRLNSKDSLTSDEKAMLKALVAKEKKLRAKQAKEVPPKSDRPKNKKQPSKPDMSMAMNKGGYAKGKKKR